MYKILSKNKKALTKYQISDRLEAGIVLKGHEVKAVKSGKMNLADSYITINKSEAFLKNAHISQYEKSSENDYNPKRDRKLLLKTNEIKELDIKNKKGFTVVPINAYLKKSFIKLEIAIVKSKNKRSKKEELKKKSIQKQIAEELKNI